MHTTTAHRSMQRLVALPVFVLLFALAAAWLAAGSASAVTWEIVEPTAPPTAPPIAPPTDVTQPTEPTEPTYPQPEPELHLKAYPVCDKKPGIKYELNPTIDPKLFTDYQALWGPASGGAVNAHPGQSGFIASGESHFVLYGHAVLDKQQYDSNKVEVTVKCDDPGKRRTPDPDKPRPGKPNFTG